MQQPEAHPHGFRMAGAVIHGTPNGYTLGCRGSLCTNHHSATHMSCTEAHIRYAGDWAFMRAVDAGTADTLKVTYTVALGARLVAETAAEAASRPARASRAKTRTGTPKPAPKRREKARHGTAWGYKLFRCRDDCPETFTCRMAANESRMVSERARKVQVLAA